MVVFNTKISPPKKLERIKLCRKERGKEKEVLSTALRAWAVCGSRSKEGCHNRLTGSGRSLPSPQSIAVVSSPSEKSHTSNIFASWEMVTIFRVSIKEILIMLAPEYMLAFIFPEHTKSNNY